MIKGMMFSSPVTPPGQVIFSGDGYGEINTTWTVPPGVYEISAVVVGAYSDAYAVIQRGVAGLLSTGSLIGGNVGGGNAGYAGSPGGAYGPPNRAGAGGAGGYSGNGGNGGSTSAGGSDVINGTAGSAGAGGGGGGGGAGVGGFGYYGGGGAGGGVGLLGIGSNGAGGAAGVPGGAVNGAAGGSGSPQTILCGGGFSHSSYGNTSGGSLRWGNAIAVTPGEVLTLRAYRGVVGGHQVFAGGSCISGIRIMWGGGRSYPSNAGNI